MSLLLVLGSPEQPQAASGTTLQATRFIYDLVFRGEIREEDTSFLSPSIWNLGPSILEQKITKAKLIRITEVV